MTTVEAWSIGIAYAMWHGLISCFEVLSLYQYRCKAGLCGRARSIGPLVIFRIVGLSLADTVRREDAG